MEVNGQLRAPAALPPGKTAGTYWIRDWVGLWAGLDVSEGRENSLCSLRRCIIQNLYMSDLCEYRISPAWLQWFVNRFLPSQKENKMKLLHDRRALVHVTKILPWKAFGVSSRPVRHASFQDPAVLLVSLPPLKLTRPPFCNYCCIKLISMTLGCPLVA